MKYRAGIAIAMLAVLTGSPAASRQMPGDPPDGLDYLMAVQCAGLSHAVAVFESYEGAAIPAERRARQFAFWAHRRASESGRDLKLVDKDVAASREDFLAEGGKGTNKTRLARLEGAYAGELKACHMLSGIADYVIIGG
jgi:hypothetical protein